MVYSVFSESLLWLLWVKDRTITSKKTNKQTKMTKPGSNWGCIRVVVCSSPERSPWTFFTIPTTLWASWSILGGFIEKKLTHWERRIRLPMQEKWVRSTGGEDLLEKERATHSTILAWEIPWTEEHGGLESMGSQRVRHDWTTKQRQQQLSFTDSQPSRIEQGM